jgi:hypothetical protein
MRKEKALFIYSECFVCSGSSSSSSSSSSSISNINCLRGVSCGWDCEQRITLTHPSLPLYVIILNNNGDNNFM